ncbi:membrane protein [Spirochaetia bacterium]|nr:membrane protein [Spirochaetia bacterium]
MGAYEEGKKKIGIILLCILSVFSIINGIFQWPYLIRSTITQFEHNIAENIIGRNEFIEVYGLLQKIMDKEETDNFYLVKDKNGAMNYGNFYLNIDSFLESSAKRMKRMEQLAAPQGTSVFFINPPALYIREKMEFTSGLPYADYNSVQDGLLYYLHKYDIDYLDLRDTLKKHHILLDCYFFKTDHHWRIETAFAAFCDIIVWFRDKYDLDLDPDHFYTNINNYNIKSYPQSSIGAMGRRTGVIFGGLDDYTFIWPKFDPDITYQTYFDSDWRSTSIRGPLSEVLLNTELIQTSEPYDTDFYAFYEGGIKSTSKIINHDNPDGPRIMMIRDSFSLPLVIFMAPLFSEIELFWPVSGEEKTDIESYLKKNTRKNTFDYIIVELDQGNIHPDNIYFYGEPWQEEKE